MSDDLDFEKFALRRNNFYRNQYRRMVTILIIMLFIGAGLMTSLVLLLWSAPAAKYYASTTTGNVVPIESLGSPVVTMPFVEQWSSLVVRSAYSLNFLHYPQQLKKARTFFTPEGWASFEAALKGSGYIAAIKQDKLSVSTVVNGPVVMVNRYVSHGRYTWVVQMPLLVLYTSASQQIKRQFYVTLTIKRVPELEVARGISVTNFVSHGSLS